LRAPMIMTLQSDLPLAEIHSGLAYDTPVEIVEDLASCMGMQGVHELALGASASSLEIGMYLRFMSLVNFYGDYGCEILAAPRCVLRVWRAHIADRESYCAFFEKAGYEPIAFDDENSHPETRDARLRFTTERITAYFGRRIGSDLRTLENATRTNTPPTPPQTPPTLKRQANTDMPPRLAPATKKRSIFTWKRPQ